jgi:outer membrane protein assembly factor BamB
MAAGSRNENLVNLRTPKIASIFELSTNRGRGSMARDLFSFAPLVLISLLFPSGSYAQGTPAREWLTWGYDQERTGWNKGETTLSKDNVSRLELKWSTQLSTKPSELVLSTVTAPLVAEGVETPQGRKNLVFLVGSDDTIYSIDADTGKVLWQKTFPNRLTPKQNATWLCSNTQNSTPAIDKRKAIIYLNTSDGKLRGLSLSNGEDRIVPTDFVTPFARNWSLNLIGDVVYSPTARGCGLSMGSIAAMDLTDPTHPQLSHFYTSGGRPAGPWGRGGVVRGPRGIYTQTADGLPDPASGVYGESVLALSQKPLRVVDSFTPANWEYLNTMDFDMGSAGPVIFPFQKWTLLASAAKEGIVYLLDANALGGGPPEHSKPLYQSPLLGNDEELMGGRGVWGAMATYENPQGERFLYVPMWGPPSKNAPPFKYSYDAAPHGSVMAFQVSTEGEKPMLIPEWISRDMHVPDPPVVANGVVYAIQTGEQTIQNPGRGDKRGGTGPGAPAAGAGPGAQGGAPQVGPGPGGAAAAALQSAKFRATPVSNLVLYALDAQTGKQLYSSEKIITSWVHYSEPVVALGKVFVVTWDAHVYAFGLKQ